MPKLHDHADQNYSCDDERAAHLQRAATRPIDPRPERDLMNKPHSDCAGIESRESGRDEGPQLGIFLWGAVMIVFWISIAIWWWLS